MSLDNVPIVPECPVFLDTHDATSEPPDGLSPRQREAIDLLLSGASETSVAQALGVNRRTLYRWRKHHPTFAGELQRLRWQRYERAADQFRSMMEDALNVLQDQMRDVYAATAFRAARAILVMAALGKFAASSATAPEPDAMDAMDASHRPHERSGAHEQACPTAAPHPDRQPA